MELFLFKIFCRSIQGYLDESAKKNINKYKSATKFHKHSCQQGNAEYFEAMKLKSTALVLMAKLSFIVQSAKNTILGIPARLRGSNSVNFLGKGWICWPKLKM